MVVKEPLRKLLGPGEVAAMLGLSKPHVYTMAAAGTLPSIKLGRAVRFDPRDVDRFIRDHRRRPGAKKAG